MTGAVEVVRHPRARRARLSVDPLSGRVRLTLPVRAALAPALRWVEQHEDWIATRRAGRPPLRPFTPGATIPFNDGTLTIDWVETRARLVVRDVDRLLCGGPPDGLARRVEAWLRREALRLLSEETAEFAARVGVAVTRVAIGDARSRWGSCSRDGVLRYSWRLILAPSFVRRSTVAHEVAHRVHMNHGAAFHRLVAELDECDPVQSGAWLRRHGIALHLVGCSS